MPYIPRERRKELEMSLIQLVDTLGPGPAPGDMNYVIASLLDRCFAYPLHYGRINVVMGVLECVKQEFYRRIGSLYEDRAREENGDARAIQDNGEVYEQR